MPLVYSHETREPNECMSACLHDFVCKTHHLQNLTSFPARFPGLETYIGSEYHQAATNKPSEVQKKVKTWLQDMDDPTHEQTQHDSASLLSKVLGLIWFSHFI